MVEADYLMKRIVDGSDSLEIDGFESLTDMLLNKAKEDLTQDKPISISFLNRFWFFSGEDKYIEDKGVVFIEKCEVTLLTEEEFLSKTGEVSGTGQSNPFAQMFSEKFTEKYSQIATQRPIYAELERLFRFVTMAKVMEEKEVLSESGLDLDYLLNQYPVIKTSVDRILPVISNVKRFEYTRDYPGGYEIVQLALPSCGGLSMAIKINTENFVKDKTGQILILKKNVLKTRSTPDVLYWDFPFKTGRNEK